MTIASVALERGSIEGQVFHRGAVVELSPAEGRDDVPAALTVLMDREFIQAAEAAFVDEAAFRFRHILVRDAAYAGVPKKLRADLHERFADWLLRRIGDRIAEYEEILGYHLEQAARYQAELGPLDAEGRELGRAAARRLASAGQRALARGDLSAARSFFSRIMTLLPPSDPVRLTLVPDRGAAIGYRLESDYRKRAALGRLDEETQRLARTAAERLSAAGHRAIKRGDPTAAVNLFAKAYSLLPDSDPLGREILPHLIAALVQTGEIHRAAWFFEEATAIANACDDAELTAQLQPLRSTILTLQPQRTPES